MHTLSVRWMRTLPCARLIPRRTTVFSTRVAAPHAGQGPGAWSRRTRTPEVARSRASPSAHCLRKIDLKVASVWSERVEFFLARADRGQRQPR